MVIVEHKNTGDVEHITPYETMDEYIRTKLTPGVYFTIKARTSTERDATYKAPSENKWQ